LRSLFLTLCLLLVITACAFGQQFNGTFTGNSDDTPVTLKLTETDGKVTGTFSDGTLVLQIEGKIEGGKLTGTGTPKGIPVKMFIRASRTGDRLTLEVAPPDDAGKADWDDADKVVLTAQDKGKDADPAPNKPDAPIPTEKPTAADNSITGKFKGADIQIEVKASGDSYSGTITQEGKAYPFTAKKEGPGIVGKFKVGSDEFEFLAKMESGQLQMKTGDTVYVMDRADAPKVNPLSKPDAKNPLAKPPANNPLTKTAGAKGDKPEEVRTIPQWRILQHPLGLSVRYPRDWAIAKMDDGYKLTPPGTEGSTDEVYAITGQSAEGIKSAADPRVTQAIDAVVGQNFPGFQRRGAGDKLNAGSVPGMAFTFEGGQGVKARLYVIILKDVALSVLGVGKKEKIDAKDSVLQQIFQSFGTKEAARDPQLVGKWTKTGETSIDARDNVGRLQASSTGSSSRTLILLADGTCVSREWSRTIAIGKGVSIDTGDQVTEHKGKWCAGDGVLVLMWDDGAEEYPYQVQLGNGGKQVIAKLGNGKATVWSQTQ
jgi:hypothetical protein